MSFRGLNLGALLMASATYFLCGFLLLAFGGFTFGIREMGFASGSWLLIAVGLLIIGLGVYQALYKKYLFEEGLRAEARVVDVIENFNHRFQGRPSLDVHYVFVTDHNEEIEGFTRTFDYDQVRRAHSSGFVTVAYEPSNPARHMVLDFYCN